MKVFKADDYVQILATDGLYRYGYIAATQDKGFTLIISMFDEGESKLAFDSAYNAIIGQESINYVSILTDVEKRMVPLLAAGYDTNKIAEELTTSPVTVRAQLRTLRLKLHLDDRAQLTAFSPALQSMIEKQAAVDEVIEKCRNQPSN